MKFVKLYKLNLLLIGIFAAVSAIVLFSGETKAGGSYYNQSPPPSQQQPHHQPAPQHSGSSGGNIFQQVYYLGADKCKKFIDRFRGNEVQPTVANVNVAISQPFNGQVVYGDTVEVVVHVENHPSPVWDLVVDGRTVERVRGHRARTPQMSQGVRSIEAHLVSEQSAYVLDRDVIQVQMNQTNINNHYSNQYRSSYNERPSSQSRQGYSQQPYYQSQRPQSQPRYQQSPYRSSSQYGNQPNYNNEPYYSEGAPSYVYNPILNAYLPCYLEYCGGGNDSFGNQGFSQPRTDGRYSGGSTYDPCGPQYCH